MHLGSFWNGFEKKAVSIDFIRKGIAGGLSHRLGIQPGNVKKLMSMGNAKHIKGKEHWRTSSLAPKIKEEAGLLNAALETPAGRRAFLDALKGEPKIRHLIGGARPVITPRPKITAKQVKANIKAREQATKAPVKKAPATKAPATKAPATKAPVKKAPKKTSPKRETTNTSKTNKRKGWGLIGGSVLGAGALGGGAYYLKKKREKKDPNQMSDAYGHL